VYCTDKHFFFNHLECPLLDQELGLTPEVGRLMLLRLMGLVLALMIAKMMTKIMVEAAVGSVRTRIVWIRTTADL
jgi:hypothetical protein